MIDLIPSPRDCSRSVCLRTPTGANFLAGRRVGNYPISGGEEEEEK